MNLERTLPRTRGEKRLFYHVPMFCGRPERESVITHDDILNLVIAMNTETSMDDFMEMV